MLLGVQLTNAFVSTPLTWPATGLSDVSARMGRFTFSNQLFSIGHLGAHAGGDAVVVEVAVEVVVDVDQAEADAGVAAAGVDERVVVVGHGEVAGVLVPGVVAVAHQRGLVVVVEARPGDGDEVGPVVDVEQAVVEVDAVLAVAEEVAVVDPDVVGRRLTP